MPRFVYLAFKMAIGHRTISLELFASQIASFCVHFTSWLRRRYIPKRLDVQLSAVNLLFDVALESRTSGIISETSVPPESPSIAVYHLGGVSPHPTSV